MPPTKQATDATRKKVWRTAATGARNSTLGSRALPVLSTRMLMSVHAARSANASRTTQRKRGDASRPSGNTNGTAMKARKNGMTKVTSPAIRATNQAGHGGSWVMPMSANSPMAIAMTRTVPAPSSSGPIGFCGTRLHRSAPTPTNDARPTTYRMTAATPSSDARRLVSRKATRSRPAIDQATRDRVIAASSKAGSTRRGPSARLPLWSSRRGRGGRR